MSDRLNGKRALAYTGVQAPTPPQLVIERRHPRESDIKGYDIGTIWLVKQGPYIFMLVDLNVGGADWIELYPGAAGAASQFPADAGTAVAQDNELRVLGGTNINTVGGSNILTVNLNDDVVIDGTLTLPSLDPGIAIINDSNELVGSDGTKGEILIASSTGLPEWRLLDSSDTSIDFTFSDNYIDIRAVGGGSSGAIEQLDTDFGSATPTGGIIKVLGGTNTNTDAALDTLFVNMDDNVTLAGNLTLSGLGAGVLVSDAAGVVTSSSGNNGELLIGATGASPAWAELDSSDGSITITSGANSIDLVAVSGGGGGEVAALTADDGNTATPTSGIISIAGGENINTVASSSTLTINLDRSINLPATTADGSEGLYTLDGFDFMHAYGTQNTFLGKSAGNRTLTAEYNTGVGAFALRDLTSGAYNTALGQGAATSLTTGSYNTALGAESMGSAHSGSSTNVAIGYQAMAQAAGPSTNNVAIGYRALYSNAISTDIISDNIAVGYGAGLNCKGEGNILLGYDVASNMTTGDANIIIGYQSGSSYSGDESNNIVIDNAGVAGDNNTIRIGTDGLHSTCHIAGIYTGDISPDKIVFVDSNDQLGTNDPAENGQLLIGSSTGDVNWGNLTSSDNSINISFTSSGNLDLEAGGTEDRDSFGAHSYNATNVTGDGTEYYFGTERGFIEFWDTTGGLDPGGSGNPLVFTASVGGIYYFEVMTPVTNLKASTYTSNYIAIITTNRSYYRYNIPLNQYEGIQTFNYAVLANMSAGHTARFSIRVSGGTKQVGLDRGTYINGYRVQGV